MSFQIGIVGLPNVGKSSLFQVLTKKQVDTSNYPFATIDPNVGVVAVPDERHDVLTKMESSAKTIPTTIEFVDIAGLVKGASQGEGLGNKFLANIREVDAIAEVVRAFDDPNVIHVAGKVDPQSDTATIDIELAMADLATVEKRVDTLSKQKKAGLNKLQAAELALVERLQAHLGDGQPVREFSLTDDEALMMKSLNLLTSKPLIYILNVSEDQVAKTNPADYELPTDRTVIIAVKVEQELLGLAPPEAAEYLQSLGLQASGLDRLIQAAYRTLGLITFLTTGPDETRAWTIPAGTKAPQAAAVIHTDFEQHFIRVEVVSYPDLVAAGSWEATKAAGKLRIEGKEYIVQDGDVVFFRVNA
jgi:GTP-binding protein YchF